MKYFLYLLFAFAPWILSSCVPAVELSAPFKPTAVSTSTSTLTALTELTPTASATVVRPLPTLPPTSTRIAIGTSPPTSTPEPTKSPTTQPTVKSSETGDPFQTPYPTPSNLPAAPRGWEWQLHAAGIPVTHYIIYELSPDIENEEKERPYGLDDQPIPGIPALPRTFLLETGYQGSGRLPDGNILQFADVRPPVERDLVPFRYLITPKTVCDGHPLAGNGTCSVPLKTAATTWAEGKEPLVPVGSTIFIPELNMKLRINDVAVSDGPPKIDLYTGTINNYDYERPDGAAIWILREIKRAVERQIHE